MARLDSLQAAAAFEAVQTQSLKKQLLIRPYTTPNRRITFELAAMYPNSLFMSQLVPSREGGDVKGAPFLARVLTLSALHLIGNPRFHLFRGAEPALAL